MGRHIDHCLPSRKPNHRSHYYRTLYTFFSWLEGEGLSGEPLEAEAAQLVVRRLGRKAHIPDFHVHRLRHTLAIPFLKAGGQQTAFSFTGPEGITMEKGGQDRDSEGKEVLQ